MEAGVDDFHRACPDRYEILKEHAREMRKDPTEAEAFMWKQLKGNGCNIAFKRQCVILDYIADFYAPSKKLIVEIDGGYHQDPEQIILDENRTGRLERMGYRVMRFTNEQVLCDIENVLKTIEDYTI